MTRSPGPRFALIPLAAAVALLAPAGRPAHAQSGGASCADCCKLPCIEGQLWEAAYMKGVYQRMAKIKGLSEAAFAQREADAHQLAAAIRGMYVGNNPACAWYMPPQGSPEERRFILAGYKPIHDDSGAVVGWNYDLEMASKDCTFDKRKLDLYPSLPPCEGMARAVLDHEQRHSDDCDKQRLRGGPLPGPAARAQNEVNGYTAEMSTLEAVRREAAQACTKKSCKEHEQDFNRAARLFHTDIEAILGLGKTKPPSKSPLRRGGARG
jgi:hypothetical protein